MKNFDDIYGYLVDTANLISQSRFGDKMILKGGSVLMSKLTECGRDDLKRITRDLDIHCDKREVWIDFYTNIESILNSNNLGYTYRITERRSAKKGLDTSDSLKFVLNDIVNSKTIEFKIDMNIKSNTIITCDYSPILNMNTYDLNTSITDKIIVVSSKKVFRRIKDLYDIAVMASICNFSYSDVQKHIVVKHGNVELTNMLIPENYEMLKHAYDLYKGILNKPTLENLVSIDSSFLEPFYIGYNGELVWDCQRAFWVKC